MVAQIAWMCKRGSMPQCYFDSRDNGSFIKDDIGLIFSSIEKARDEATRALAELARDVLPGSMAANSQ